MLHLLLDKVGQLEEGCTFALAWPITFNALRATAPDDTAVVSLFHKSGSCRIGAIEWFAYAFDGHHPSGLLTVDQDVPAMLELYLTEAEKFAIRLESIRSTLQVGMMTVVVADKFRGHSDADVEKMATLSDLVMIVKRYEHALNLGALAPVAFPAILVECNTRFRLSQRYCTT